jgi:hypothetical protein
MAQGQVSTVRDKAFEKEVDALAREGKNLIQSYSDLTERMLTFAQRFQTLWKQAKALDGSDDGSHHSFLRDRLSELVNTSNPSIQSRWVTIGSNAKALMPFKNALPHYRDSLYEVALAVESKKPVKKWVKEKRITIESSVREVRSLRVANQKQKKTKAAGKPSKSTSRSFPATITLSFETFEAAANILTPLLTESADFKVSAPQAFDAAIREKLDSKDYERAKKHLA